MIRNFCRERNQLLVLKSILSGQAFENEDVNASLQNNWISFPWLKKLVFNALSLDYKNNLQSIDAKQNYENVNTVSISH